jgi:trans-2-enoyl-CoA reductase
VNALDDRMTQEHKARETGIEQAQRETEERMKAEMRALLDTHKRLRLVGLGLLISGTICLNAGNFT